MQNSEALRIIQALADGVDPTTGEVLEENSPFQNPQIVRALFAAADALERRVGAENRSRRLPENAGAPWTKQDDEGLARDFDAGFSIPDLAMKLKRTRGSVRTRLERLGKVRFREG